MYKLLFSLLLSVVVLYSTTYASEYTVDIQNGATIINKTDYTPLTNIISLTYHPGNKFIHYIRKEKDGKFIRGITKMENVIIKTNDGELVYDHGWYHLVNNQRFKISQNHKTDIYVE